MKKYLHSKNYFYILLTTLIVVLSSSAVKSQEYKVRMAMIGNSITYGALLTDPSTECYPARLSILLSEIHGDTCDVQNYGVSGRTMMRSAENPIWTESSFETAIKSVPDICLIMLGTNDSKPYRWEAWGDEFLDDYMAMIDTFLFRNPYTEFIVCYPPPIWEGHPYGTTFDNSHNDSVLINCIIPVIDTVVTRTGALLVDFHTPFLDSVDLFPDKLHPGAEASKMMAEILFADIMEAGLIEKIDAGRAFVSDFTREASPVKEGDMAELSWTTIFADSVFLNETSVDASGSAEVTAYADSVYTLTAKNTKNTASFSLTIDTYTPEKSDLAISCSSTDYKNGDSVILYVTYVDQNNAEMPEKTSDVTWTITTGEGSFGTQTDTSIVFIPTVIGKVVIEATEGDLSTEETLTVSKLSSINTVNSTTINVFPNPANDKLFFQLEQTNTDNIQIQIFTISGEKISEYHYNTTGLTNSIIESDISAISPGVYIYTINMNEEEISGQFVKQARE